MDDEMGIRANHRLDEELTEELQRLRPLLQRQRRAAGVRPESGFKRALRAQLTAAPRAAPARKKEDPPHRPLTSRASGSAAAWRTLIARLMPAPPQLSLRGHGPQAMTYTAGGVTISLTAQPAGEPGGGLISLYGEVDDIDAAGGADAATVEVLRGEAVVATAALDELGNFVLRDLPPRVYALRLRLPDRREVIIPPAGYDAEGEASAE